MIYLFLNGLGASAGAGLTYLYNVLPQLSAMPKVRTTLAVQRDLRGAFGGFPNVVLADVGAASGAARRFWLEQRELPAVIRKSGAEVLISAGNFALRKSPVPQILLSGNSLYTSGDFYRDLRSRREYRMWAETRIRGSFARRSVDWAERTVAPSQAFVKIFDGGLERMSSRFITALTGMCSSRTSQVCRIWFDKNWTPPRDV